MKFDKRFHIFRRYRRFIKREFNCSVDTINHILQDDLKKIRGDFQVYEPNNNDTTVSIIRIQYMKHMILNKDLILLRML